MNDEQKRLDLDNQVERLVRTMMDSQFEIKHKDDDGAFVLTNGELRVGIFPPDYPHSIWKNHVLAEHEDNFDKWSKHFYKCDIPSDATEELVLMNDLRHIQNEENKKIGTRFGLLTRSF